MKLHGTMLATVTALALGPAAADEAADVAACSALIDGNRMAPAMLAGACNNRGTAHAVKGALAAAIADYDAAIRLRPGYAAALFNRGAAHAEGGAFARALADFDATHRAKPEEAVFLNAKAWLLATAPDQAVRDGAAAVDAAEAAVRLDGRADHCDTLATAYAAAGRFADAVDAEQRAIAKLTEEGGDAEAMGFNARLARYRAGKPYR